MQKRTTQGSALLCAVAQEVKAQWFDSQTAHRLTVCESGRMWHHL